MARRGHLPDCRTGCIAPRRSVRHQVDMGPVKRRAEGRRRESGLRPGRILALQRKSCGQWPGMSGHAGTAAPWSQPNTRAPEAAQQGRTVAGASGLVLKCGCGVDCVSTASIRNKKQSCVVTSASPPSLRDHFHQPT